MDLLPPRIAKKIISDPSGCWLWSTVGNYGYGRARDQHPDGSLWMRQAHRLVYELLVGPIPEGLTLDHLCRVRQCVNPDHLEPVTSRENTLRGETLPALNARKTHCPQGHPYAGENLRINRRGSRACCECLRVANRKHRDGKRGRPTNPDRFHLNINIGVPAKERLRAAAAADGVSMSALLISLIEGIP